MIRVYREEEVHQIHEICFIWICLPFVNHSEIIYPNCENKINKIYRGCLSDIVGTLQAKVEQSWLKMISRSICILFYSFLPLFLPLLSLFSICGIFYIWLFRSSFFLTTPISKYPSSFYSFCSLFEYQFKKRKLKSFCL